MYFINKARLAATLLGAAAPASAAARRVLLMKYILAPPYVRSKGRGPIRSGLWFNCPSWRRKSYIGSVFR